MRSAVVPGGLEFDAVGGDATTEPREAGTFNFFYSSLFAPHASIFSPYYPQVSLTVRVRPALDLPHPCLSSPSPAC